MIYAVNMPSFHPNSFSDLCAEKLSLLANYAKAAFWFSEQNMHYAFLPLKGTLGQEDERFLEIIKRCLITPPAAAATLFCTPLALLGHMLTALSNQLHSRDFVYLEGLAQEVNTLTPKIMHLNVCMFAGGLPYEFGSMRTAGERFEKGLIRLVHDETPDLLFLCEFSETLTPRLYENLKASYRHFFVNIGSNPWGMDASLAVVSKVPLMSEPRFVATETEAEGDQKFMVRGYFILETDTVRILYAHLHPKETPQAEAIRHEQLKEIRLIMDNEGPPWILMGDLNINRGSELHKEIKEGGLIDVIENQHGQVPTFMRIDGEEESLDYFLTLESQPVLMETTIVETYRNPKNALSDHKAIFCKIKRPCSYEQGQ